MNFRQEAYSIIYKVLKEKDYSDVLLHQKAKKLRASGEDPSLFYNLVKGTIKMSLQLDFILSHFTDAKKFASTDIKIKAILYIGLYQILYLKSIPEHAAVNESVELAKSLFNPQVADFVNAVLRNYIRAPKVEYPTEPALRIAYEHSFPPELIKQWLLLWGEEATEYLALFFNESPELHIRVNGTATSPEKLLAYFAKRDIKITPSLASKRMFHSDQAAQILDDVAFSEGYFSVQDTSAALIVELLDPQKDDSVLDLFAAPGGKCTYIAELMDNSGEIIAVDKIPNKMKLLKQAADRLQLSNIKLVVADAFKYGPIAPAFNRVLVDAPCSGWGVFSRKADLRWQSHNSIPELVKLQEKALDYAANFVTPDGFMVYSTCTMNPAENEAQVESFLKRNKKFELIDASLQVPQDFTSQGYLKTIPFKHHMDGAFAARMTRTS